MMQELKRLNPPVKLGIIGMGAMGKGLFYQTDVTPGFECLAISDIDLGRAVQVAEWLKHEYHIVASEKQASNVIDDGRLAIAQDGFIIAGCSNIDVLIEASSSVVLAGRYCELALMSGTHVIMMNAEADLVFGPYLLKLARENGVVYSSCDGDQHGVIKQLYDDMVLWGFQPVMAGNIKGFLDRYSNPHKIIPEADKRKLDYHMATAYTDGTKLNIEMSLVANALDMRALVPGMSGHVAKDVKDVFSLFDFNKLWYGNQAFVDYILGAEPGGGVFTVGYSENEYQRFMMNYYKMGPGPFYLFYRPYHLCHVESLKWIARAFIDGKALLRPDHGFKTNVIAYAKVDLRQEDTLDGLGGFKIYGLIENTEEYNDEPGLPVCLAKNVKLKIPVTKDQRIGMADVDISGLEDGFQMYYKAVKASRELTRESYLTM